MTIADAQAVMDRMESDEAFAQRIKDAGGPDASLAILKGEGFDVSAQDMRDAAIDRYGDQLTNEQLDVLAGGQWTEEQQNAYVVGASAVIGVAAAATAAAAV